jgi:hypothetical protein
MSSYITLLIQDNENQSIIFDQDDQNIKAKLIDYLAMYSNAMIIKNIQEVHDTLVDNTIIVQYKVNIKADMRDTKNLLNYLQE